MSTNLDTLSKLLSDKKEPTETEKAFGLVGEDEAISFKEYTEKNIEEQNEEMIKEYLQDEDAFYGEEYLRGLEPNRLVDILYDEDRDLVEKYTDPSKQAEQEIVLKEVPRAIAPYVRVVAKGGGFVVVKPLSEVEPAIREDVIESLKEAKETEVKQEIEKDFGKQELVSRKPTLREQHSKSISNLLLKTGMAENENIASSMARSFVGGEGQPLGLGVLDFTPLGAGYALEESGQDIARLRRSSAGATDYIAPTAIAALSVAETLPFVKGATTLVKGAIKGTPIRKPVKTIDDIRTEVEAQLASADQKALAKKADDKFNIERAIDATRTQDFKKREAARKKAEKNQKLLQDLIKSYEETHFADEIKAGDANPISKKVNGKLVIDYEKARNVGKTRLNDLDLADDEISALGFGEDGYRMAILNPDKMDALVATVADLKEAKPELFKKGKIGIEELFDAAVEGNLVASKELNTALDKYGLSMDDFVIQVVGSGSYYGKGLQKFKALKEAMLKGRMTPEQIEERRLNNAIKKPEGAWQKFLSGSKRVEDIVRGLMVSQFATAARNFESFLTRMPIQGLEGMFEDVIYKVATGESAKIGKGNPFKNNFRMYGEMFRDPIALKEYTEFILDRPQFAEQFDQMFNQVNEIRRSRGQGTGKGMDYMLSNVENFVDFLNTPNRMQEFLARRTMFLSHLDKLTQREYGLDLIDTINKGGITDLINDSVSLIGEGKRSFKELLADATAESMNATYAAGPKFPPFKAILKGLNAIPGSTFFIPFPRFMFKSMEYMAELVAGMPIAGVRKIMGIGEDGLVTSQGKLTYNGELAARNLAGLTAIGTVSLAAEADLIDDDGRIILPNGKALDITAQYPLAQLAWIGVALKKDARDEFTQWFNGREFVKLFTGTNFRNNTGLGDVMDDLFLQLAGEAQVGAREASAEATGKLLADMTLRVFTPLNQFIELERGLGFRDTTYRSYESDPDMTLGGSFAKGFKEKVRSRGFSLDEYTPEFIGQPGTYAYSLASLTGFTPEDRAEEKAYATKPGGKDRIGSLYKLVLGLNVVEQGTPEQKFLRKYGYHDWDLSSRTNVGTVDNAINETLSGVIPGIVRQMEILELKYKQQNKSERFIRNDIRERIRQSVNDVKVKINKSGLKLSGADDPAYVQEVFKFRKYNVESQRAIFEVYEDTYDETADMTNTNDIKKLNDIGKRLRYKKRIIE